MRTRRAKMLRDLTIVARMKDSSSTSPTLLRPTSATTSTPAATCSVCRRGRSIGGDGVEICRACLIRIGDMAVRPAAFSDAERRVFLEAHGDVVELVWRGEF